MFIANERAIAGVQPFFAGASLTALDKKNGADVRQIAAGETLRRLISKCLCAKVKAAARSHFAPEQFGVATRGGTDRVIHMLRTIYYQHVDDDDFVVLKVDLRNAFNNVSRAEMMTCVESSFPVLLPWVRWCYSSDSHLWYQDWRLSSQEGVQQGDPL